MTTRPFAMDLNAERNESAGGHNRRQEARVADCHCCAYEICEPDQDGLVAICEGQLITVNRSAHGILLLMREAPRVNQLIEVHSQKLGWLRSMMVYHVRWIRPIRIETGESMLLVGGRLTAGLSAIGQSRSSRRTDSI